MAGAATKAREFIYEWEGRDRQGKSVRGEMRSAGEAAVGAHLRRQGIAVRRVRRRRLPGGRAIRRKDIALFTRQLATLLRAGVPLLRAFDIVARGSGNPRLARLLQAVRADVETGTSLSAALRKHPQHFSALYCNSVQAGESGGVLEPLLERLALHEEKALALQGRIRSALFYPVMVLAVSALVLALILGLVIPAFSDVFRSFGAALPAPTRAVIALSELFLAWWPALLALLAGSTWAMARAWRRSQRLRDGAQALLLKTPVFGPLVFKAVLARWTRTLSMLFAAGVPLVEALSSAGAAAGNAVVARATAQVRKAVAAGTALSAALQASGVFPGLVLQLAAIGEESGTLDAMLAKAAEFYENEVDESARGLASLMEPAVIVILGGLIGGIVVAMYLPVFKLGAIV
ncbi:type II secretion system F family protein [Azohydromonas caseinilytica]|uniref:Type II secretion system F family protein n=1 Tax=Azohydromonas caseinilytica TaxID=2728836 RepID=A0A848FB69_9BURK|nr:type II secretion system F family protein [Azohydromonas caseinilytica]NML15201.1 type II secretion system F family protein [Azohydromonas caseinilytica]